MLLRNRQRPKMKVSLPFDLPPKGVLKEQTRKKLVRQGMHRSWFRRLVPAVLVQFPFVAARGTDKDTSE